MIRTHSHKAFENLSIDRKVGLFNEILLNISRKYIQSKKTKDLNLQNIFTKMAREKNDHDKALE